MKKDRDAMRLYHYVSEEKKHALRKLKEPHLSDVIKGIVCLDT